MKPSQMARSCSLHFLDLGSALTKWLLEAQADGLLEGAKPIRGGLRRHRCSQALPHTFDLALAHTSEHYFFKALIVDGELVESNNIIDMVLLGAEGKLHVWVVRPL